MVKKMRGYKKSDRKIIRPLPQGRITGRARMLRKKIGLGGTTKPDTRMTRREDQNDCDNQGMLQNKIGATRDGSRAGLSAIDQDAWEV